jgi:elongation factor 1-alpha
MKIVDPQSKPRISLGFIGLPSHGKTTLLANITQTQEIGDIKTPELNESQSTDFLRLSLDALKYEKNSSTVKEKYTSFTTSKFHFYGVDTPGRKKYFKHFLKGVSIIDLAILVVDVSSDSDLSILKDQLIACKVFGVQQFIVCLNKIDTVKFSKEKFEMMKEKISYVLKKYSSNENAHFIPISAITGENIFQKSTNMNFYEGLCLMEVLDSWKPFKRDFQSPLRINTLDVVKIGGVGTVFVGRIESGILYPGMILSNSEIGQGRLVRSIEKNLECASCGLPGDIVGVNLKNISTRDIKTGFVFGNAFDGFPRAVDSFKATTKSLKPLNDGRICTIICHLSAVTCKIKILEKKEDFYLIEFFTLRSRKYLFLEEYAVNPKYGRFCMESQHQILGFGKVLEVKFKDFNISPFNKKEDFDSNLKRVEHDAMSFKTIDPSEISKSFVIQAMKLNPFVYKYLPKEFSSDKDILSMECLVKHPSLYFELPTEAKADKETLLKYMKNSPFVILFSSEELRNNEEISIKMMEQHSMNVEFLSKKFSNPELIFDYIKNDLKILKYSLYNFSDFNFVKRLIYFFPIVIKHTPYLWGDEEFMKENIARNGVLIKFANKKWVTNELILKAIKNNPKAFHFIDRAIDKNIALALLNKLPKAYTSLPYKLQIDEDVAFQTVKSENRLISILHPKVQKVPRILLESYKGIAKDYYYGTVYFDEKLQNDEKFLLKAIESYEVIFQRFVPLSLKNDKNFVKKAMEANGNVFKFLVNPLDKENRDYLLLAVKKKASNFFDANKSLYEKDKEILFSALMGIESYTIDKMLKETNIEKNFSGDSEFIEKLLTSRPSLWKFFSPEFIKDFRNKEFILKLMDIDIHFYEHLEANFREDFDIAIKYVRNVKNTAIKIPYQVLENIDVQWASRKMYISIKIVNNHDIQFHFH